MFKCVHPRTVSSKLAKPKLQNCWHTIKRHESLNKEYQSPQIPQWCHTMLRITNPSATIPFYENMFGMKLIHEYHFKDMGFSLYFMGTPIPNMDYPAPGTDDAERLIWNYPGVTLEFTHEYDSMTDTSVMNNGNVEPYRGFGHIAFNTNDVYQSYDNLSAKGVTFQKSPNEGRMKGLSFALDPDGYWVEICDRKQNNAFTDDVEYNLSQTMIRVKDPIRSLDFYCNKLGMKRVCEAHMEAGQFSVYFLSSNADGEIDFESKSSQERWDYMKQSFHPYLELTHNWGTEKDEEFKYHNGNDEPKGYGHTAFLVNDVDAICNKLQAEDVIFDKLPHEGKMKRIAFAVDPDGYSVEFLPRGITAKEVLID